MKKRISAIFLALCMMVGFLPVNAQADGETSHNIGDDSVTFNSSCGDHCPGHVITGTSDSLLLWEQHNITVDGGTHTIILENVTIHTPGSSSSALSIKNNADVTLELRGVNSLEGGGGGSHPAVWVQSGSRLTITGEGSLTARSKGGAGAAGIGAGDSQDFGDITIADGTVTAFGSGGGAGIGGGYQGASGTVSGNITITGGFVRAYGGRFGLSAGAGIGGGENANYGGTITISGGVVYAQSGKDNMASIGGGGSITGD